MDSEKDEVDTTAHDKARPSLRDKSTAFARTIRKWTLVLVIGVAGLLLTLAGLGLMQLSLPLILYIGLILLALAVIFFFIG